MRTRIRALIAVAGIAVAVLVMAAPATAAEAEPHFNKEAGKQCYEKAVKGGDFVPDDCQKAPSPLLPAKNEVIWGSAAFAVLLLAMWKFGVPAVKNMEKAREDRIRNDLEGAEKARTEAEAEKAQYQEQIADARNEAGRIIEEARQSAEQVRRDLIVRAEAEAAEVRQRAQADIATQQERALAELRTDVTQLSIDLAERIVEHNLDRDTQLRLVDSFIDQVGSN
ncbi:MAG TPA: F0F1 ATP synthase subunit B [Acidimicrobiia bacterium]|nr:F0F1 ATP synthase subunit B [Acidimicrobiia bacterium]